MAQLLLILGYEPGGLLLLFPRTMQARLLFLPLFLLILLVLKENSEETQDVVRFH